MVNLNKTTLNLKKVEFELPQDVVAQSGRTPEPRKVQKANLAMRKAIADIIMEEGLTALFIIEMM